jgi:hypothetical protein
MWADCTASIDRIGGLLEKTLDSGPERFKLARRQVIGAGASGRGRGGKPGGAGKAPCPRPPDAAIPTAERTKETCFWREQDNSSDRQENAMSDPHAHGSTDIQAHATGVTSALPTHGGRVLPFSDADWKEFHQSDKGAGGAIIVLMASIFSIGLVLYTIIAIVVAQ